jgi:hypothetical protein
MEVNDLITYGDYEDALSKWKETTSTSPSGRHLGHYISLYRTSGDVPVRKMITYMYLQVTRTPFACMDHDTKSCKTELWRHCLHTPWNYDCRNATSRQDCHWESHQLFLNQLQNKYTMDLVKDQVVLPHYGLQSASYYFEL